MKMRHLNELYEGTPEEIAAVVIAKGGLPQQRTRRSPQARACNVCGHRTHSVSGLCREHRPTIRRSAR